MWSSRSLLGMLNMILTEPIALAQKYGYRLLGMLNMILTERNVSSGLTTNCLLGMLNMILTEHDEPNTYYLFEFARYAKYDID